MSKRVPSSASPCSAASDDDDGGGGKLPALSAEDRRDEKIASELQAAEESNNYELSMMEYSPDIIGHQNHPPSSSSVAGVSVAAASLPATSAATLPSKGITPNTRQAKREPAIVTTAKKQKVTHRTSPAFYGIKSLALTKAKPIPEVDQIVQIHIKNLLTGGNPGKLHVKPPDFKSLSERSADIMIPSDVPDRDTKIAALNENIRKASDWPAVLKRILTFVKKDSNGRQVVFVAWNGHAYDFPQMEIECIRHNLDYNLSSSVHFYMDAMEFVKDHPTYWTSNQKPANWELTTVHAHLIQNSNFNAHDAESGTKAMDEILLLILGKNSSEWPSSVKGFLLPVSWGDSDMANLDSDKQKIAEGSLLREQIFLSTHPVFRDQERCTQIIKALPPNQLIKGSDGRLSKPAQYFGCIEYVSSLGVHRKYPSVSVDGRDASLHAIACTAKNGLRQFVNFDDLHKFETASHLCGDDHCINQDHLKWEPFRTNLSRRGCKGYIRLMNQEVVSIECNHDPRCMTFVTADETSVSEEQWNEIMEHHS